MAASTLPSSEPTEQPTNDRPLWRRPGWWVSAAVALSMAGMWIFVFGYHLSGEWRDSAPGQLADPTFAVEAEAICSSALDRISTLPKAYEIETPAERSELVRATNAEFRTMVAALTALPTTSPEDRTKVDEWLADWGTYLDDRDDFAERIAIDPNARFYVTQSERDRRQVTVAFDRFSLVNDMTSCSSYDDLA